MGKNRNTRRARLKLKQKAKNKEQLVGKPSWDTLLEINKDIIKSLVNFDKLGKALVVDCAEKLKTSAEAAETFKGFYIIIGEMAKRISALNLEHANLDGEGKPIILEDNSIDFRRGKCKNEEEQQKCLDIFFAYEQEVMNLEPLSEQVLPDLVTILEAKEEMKKVIMDLKDNIDILTSKASIDLSKAVNEYQKAMKTVSTEAAKLLETARSMEVQEGTNVTVEPIIPQNFSIDNKESVTTGE